MMYTPPPSIRSKRRMFWIGWLIGMIIGAVFSIFLGQLLGWELRSSLYGVILGAGFSISAFIKPENFEEPHPIVLVFPLVAIPALVLYFILTGFGGPMSSSIAVLITMLAETTGGAFGVWLYKRREQSGNR